MRMCCSILQGWVYLWCQLVADLVPAACLTGTCSDGRCKELRFAQSLGRVATQMRALSAGLGVPDA
jgi:hypothetical protein